MADQHFRGYVGIAYREIKEKYLDTAHPEDIAAQRVLLTVDVSLQHVVNLSSSHERKEWGISKAEVTGEWTSCQQLARNILHSHEAIQYPSATGQGENLAVFYDRLHEGSYLHLVRSEVVTVKFDRFIK